MTDAAPGGSSPVTAELRAQGWIELPVSTGAQHYDGQGHLNNAAVAQLCNDMRIRFVGLVVGPWWGRYLADEQLTVAVREAHLSYDTEGLPGEEFLGLMRYSHREGKAAVVEQRLVESQTGRVVARAWVLQLLARRGMVVEWPDEFFERVARAQGAPVERRPRAERTFDPS